MQFDSSVTFLQYYYLFSFLLILIFVTLYKRVHSGLSLNILTISILYIHIDNHLAGLSPPVYLTRSIKTNSFPLYLLHNPYIYVMVF